MIIVRPADVPPNETDSTAAVLTASNVPETDSGESGWVSGTAYDKGAIVSVLGTTQRRYESLTSGNEDNYPPTDDGTNWLDLGATNRWRMFDGGTETLTRQAESIEVTLEPRGLVNALAFFNVNANQIRVTVTPPGASEAVYDQTYELLIGVEEANWWSYFFGSVQSTIDPTRDLVLLNLPQYLDPKLEITISRGEAGETDPDAQPSIGQLILGRQQIFGSTLYGSSIGIKDYSRKEPDDFGNFQVVERRFSKTAEFDVILSTQDVSKLQRALAERRATPTVYVGSASACLDCADQIHEETLIYGYYRDFNVVLSNRNTSSLSIEIEGL